MGGDNLTNHAFDCEGVRHKLIECPSDFAMVTTGREKSFEHSASHLEWWRTPGAITGGTGVLT